MESGPSPGLSRQAGAAARPLGPPPFAAAYAEVDTAPARNPRAYGFWCKQGFTPHHLEPFDGPGGDLHWLRLTREDWLAAAGPAPVARPGDPAPAAPTPGEPAAGGVL